MPHAPCPMQGSTITAYIEVNAGQDRCGVEPGSDAAVELAQDIVYGNFAINSDYVLADFILFFSYVPAHARRVARCVSPMFILDAGAFFSFLILLSSFFFRFFGCVPPDHLPNFPAIQGGRGRSLSSGGSSATTARYSIPFLAWA